MVLKCATEIGRSSSIRKPLVPSSALTKGKAAHVFLLCWGRSSRCRASHPKGDEISGSSGILWHKYQMATSLLTSALSVAGKLVFCFPPS